MASVCSGGVVCLERFDLLERGDVRGRRNVLTACDWVMESLIGVCCVIAVMIVVHLLLGSASLVCPVDQSATRTFAFVPFWASTRFRPTNLDLFTIFSTCIDRV